MATATRIDEVIDALVDAWTQDDGIRAAGVVVYDGPFDNDLSSQYRLFVGSTGLDEDDDPSASETQVSPHAADVARDEEISVTCAVWYIDGDRDVRYVRREARRILDLAVAMPRTTQNLNLSNVFYVGFDSIALRQIQSADGAAAIYTFNIVVKCRIYS